MKIYMSMQSVPELSGVPTSERRHLEKSAWWKAHRHHWQTWLALLGAFLLIYIGMVLGGYSGNEKLGVIVGAGIGKLIYLQVVIHFGRRYLPDTNVAAGPALPAKKTIRARALLVRA
jgi:hypothetical protein